MRSSDRTLISSLGFSDPDKGDRTHDLACQYIAANAASILDGLTLILSDKIARPVDNSIRHAFEEIVSKGEGKYQTTIGFIDVVIRFDVALGDEYDPETWKPIKYSGDLVPLSIAVEVKTNPVGVGDVLRQIKLYRQYADHNRWWLVTAFPISPVDLETFHSERIRHLVLGDRFRAWVAEQEQFGNQVADSPEI